MRPPLSDSVQLNLNEYRSTIYDLILMCNTENNDEDSLNSYDPYEIQHHFDEPIEDFSFYTDENHTAKENKPSPPQEQYHDKFTLENETLGISSDDQHAFSSNYMDDLVNDLASVLGENENHSTTPFDDDYNYKFAENEKWESSSAKVDHHLHNGLEKGRTLKSILTIPPMPQPENTSSQQTALNTGYSNRSTTVSRCSTALTITKDYSALDKYGTDYDDEPKFKYDYLIDTSKKELPRNSYTQSHQATSPYRETGSGDAANNDKFDLNADVYDQYISKKRSDVLSRNGLKNGNKNVEKKANFMFLFF